MSDVKIEEFQQLPLRVHGFLAGVPLRTLARVDLLGGREGMTLPEINALVGFNSDQGNDFDPVAKALFRLRSLIGRILHWDDVKELTDSLTYLTRLSEEDRARSLVTPGNIEGISRVLYCFENEFLAEIINRTVHCFWLMASEQIENGYALYFAVYVKKLNWFTPIYMALITPMLKWIIYPSIMKRVGPRWAKAFPPRNLKPTQEGAAGQVNGKIRRITDSL
jgi:uncharacterized protein DUF2867